MNLSLVDDLLRFHDRQLQREQPFVDDDPLLAAIADNHHCNRLLWDTEDQARRPDVPDEYIVRCKRLIDRSNQQRNDAVERIDEALLQRLATVNARDDAWLNSETPGAIIDRLSILSLKIHHMRLQTQRDDANDAHIAACSAKLQVLQCQRADLAAALTRLLHALAAGDARLKVYRQFKMYNDPGLNPWLRGKVPA